MPSLRAVTSFHTADAPDVLLPLITRSVPRPVRTRCDALSPDQSALLKICCRLSGCHGATTRISHRLPRGLMAWPSCAPGSPFPICSFPVSPGSLGSFVCVRYASRSALVPCCMVAGADLRRCGVSRSPRPPIRIVIHGPLALHIARQPAHSPCWRGCLRAAVLLPHIQTPSPASATSAGLRHVSAGLVTGRGDR